MSHLIDTLHAADTHAVMLLAAIYAVATIFSGLPGFGFSAIGALSLVLLPPQMGVPVLMVLLVSSQALSQRHIRCTAWKLGGGRHHSAKVRAETKQLGA